jgi:hypothetical protein
VIVQSPVSSKNWAYTCSSQYDVVRTSTGTAPFRADGTWELLADLKQISTVEKHCIEFLHILARLVPLVAVRHPTG